MEKITAQMKLEKNYYHLKMNEMNDRIDEWHNRICGFQKSQQLLIEKHSKETDNFKSQLMRCNSQLECLQNENTNLNKQVLELQSICQSQHQVIQQNKHKLLEMQNSLNHSTSQLHQTQQQHIGLFQFFLFNNNNNNNNIIIIINYYYLNIFVIVLSSQINKLANNRSDEKAENELLRTENQRLTEENNQMRQILERMHPMYGQSSKQLLKKEEGSLTSSGLIKHEEVFPKKENTEVEHRANTLFFPSPVNDLTTQPPSSTDHLYTTKLRKQNEEQWKVLQVIDAILFLLCFIRITRTDNIFP
ncbi:hypothetical protein RFI_07006 [Reticulomyxa filosa]|uniref:Uncharacterized protein n=1 Tax=Reticulomyxa filosa TaxID=46433 RepID=X6NWB0_RETFI|nr:hypothetical protein RFI_07006 [Reticulomyxa filosa]|eukprot:ETO30114.1 hypothetical protein RFI_07006 [Reticulomyxa filosa]